MHPSRPDEKLLADSVIRAQQLLAARRLTEAEAVYQDVLSTGSASAEIYKDYGNVLLGLERFADAEQAYRQALALNPDYGVAYNNLGNVLRLCKQYEEAELAFSKALALMPDSPEVHNNFGNVLIDTGRISDAEQLFRKAIRLNPDYFIAHYNCGNALRFSGQFKEAETCYRQAIALNPAYFDAYYGLGCVAEQLGDLQEAEQAYRQVLRLRPAQPEACYGLGCILMRTDSYSEAEHVFSKAIELLPGYAEAHYGRGYALQSLGRIEEAVLEYRQAIAIKADHKGAHKALALSLLLQGDYCEGLPLHEQRFDMKYYESSSGVARLLDQLAAANRWDGQPVNGKSLLVITEQGAGDSLMMMRYLKLISQLGFKRLVIYCEAQLQRVFRYIEGVDEVITTARPLPVGLCDYYCFDMSLPFLFKTQLDSIPDRVPYLVVPDQLKVKWGARLANIAAVKVGLVWGGNKNLDVDSRRSIALNQFGFLRELPGVQPISLQKGESARQLSELGWNFYDWMDDCSDFLDTAALIAGLDLVISVDTSVAHLAGTMGKPVWLLNRYGSEWRWLLDREDSPWYPSMRIFNQKQLGDWGPVLDSVAQELAGLAGTTNSKA